jgi:hypothetical protein
LCTAAPTPTGHDDATTGTSTREDEQFSIQLIEKIIGIVRMAKARLLTETDEEEKFFLQRTIDVGTARAKWDIARLRFLRLRAAHGGMCKNCTSGGARGSHTWAGACRMCPYRKVD